jgi:hypothetical protein
MLAFFIILVVLSVTSWTKALSFQAATVKQTSAVLTPASTTTTSFLQPEISVPIVKTTSSSSATVPIEVLSNDRSQETRVQKLGSSDIASGARSTFTFQERHENEAFELTYVVYRKGDTLGWFLALVTLAPIFISVMYFTLCVTRRDLETILAFVGQIFGVFIVICIKKIINQPRPKGAQLTDSGMPSNHVSISFLSMIFVLQWSSKFFIYIIAGTIYLVFCGILLHNSSPQKIATSSVFILLRLLQLMSSFIGISSILLEVLIMLQPSDLVFC